MSTLRLAALGALAMLAVGFVWVDRYPALDPAEFQVRLERWRAMDAGEQRSLRQRWTAFQALPEERRDALRRRKATLDRLRRRHAPAEVGASESEALEAVMGEFERQARELLAVGAGGGGGLPRGGDRPHLQPRPPAAPGPVARTRP